MPTTHANNLIMMPIKHQTLTKTLSVLMLATLVAACSSNTPKLGAPATPINTIGLETPEQLLAQTITAQEPQKSKLQLRISQLYWQNNLIGQTKAAIKDVNYRFLDHTEILNFLKIRLEIAKIEHNQESLESLLNIIDSTFTNSTIDAQLESINLKLTVLELTERHIEQALILAESIGLYDIEATDSINEKIWTALKKANAADLAQFQYTGNHYDAKGWLELATTFKLNLSNIDQQLRAIKQWEEQWPAHPAAISPPKEIEIVKSLPTIRPKQILLALPFTGPLANVGQAVKDGFFAELYLNQSHEDSSDHIKLFDTSSKDIRTLYEQYADERSLVIGPIDRASLSNLSTLDALSIDTLALNSISDLPDYDNLFQFNLAPESGMNQIVNRLKSKNQNKIAVIAPDSDWGIRTTNAFAEALEAQEGILITSVFYNDQETLSEKVSTLLATDRSKQRLRKIRSIANLRMENEPRRRADIDAIFMIAKPGTAKLLKPLFSFHYAGSIPVYAGPQIHDPSSQNNDLNNIEFLELPWMLNATDATKTTIRQLNPVSADKYSRFHALGADAFKLSKRLNLLAQIPDSKFQGKTGLLAINEERKVIREMQWAKFRKGKAIPIQD